MRPSSGLYAYAGLKSIVDLIWFLHDVQISGLRNNALVSVKQTHTRELRRNTTDAVTKQNYFIKKRDSNSLFRFNSS